MGSNVSKHSLQAVNWTRPAASTARRVRALWRFCDDEQLKPGRPHDRHLSRFLAVENARAAGSIQRIARQGYGRRLPDRDGEHAHAGCFLHLFSAGGNTDGRFGVPSCTASPTPAHSGGHVAGTHIDAPGGRATITPNEPRDENVDLDETCALRR